MLSLYLALASRFHGGGFFSSPRIFRSVMFSVPFSIIGNHWVSLFSFTLAYIGVNIGHENFWLMGTGAPTPTKSWLSSLLIKGGFKYGTLGFEIIGMSIKGLITCPIGGFVVLPLAYYIGQRTRWHSVAAEYLSGFFYGLILEVSCRMMF